ncbi:thioester reductase [Ktedonobacter sp. SOSP1-85]|uniref:thioester reductase n=1 Tax=Ktedonobacter sp. SOSP1-85 TaxID=2778367 RepID=UPI001915FEFA|nr:thioester reductase [Ktedonobacter sp. SOSP1-85]
MTRTTFSSPVHAQASSSPVHDEQQGLPSSHMLLEQVLTKSEAPLDAAVLTCLPPLQKEEALLLQTWHQGRPILTQIVTTQLGRVGTFLLPVEDTHGDEQWQQKMIELACKAVALAQACGARSVSLSVPLARQTRGGQMIREHQVSCAGRRPCLTTADATTSAAVLLNLEWILTRVGRELCRERLVVAVGPDDFASTFLRLLLATRPHPASLMLCTLPGQGTHGEHLEMELLVSGFRGNVVRNEMREGEMLPDGVYEEATLLLGTGDLLRGLDVQRLRAGTILLRLPSALSPEVSEPLSARIRAHQDILAPQGDELTSPAPMRELRVFASGSLLDLLIQTGEGGGLRNPYQVKSFLLAGLAVAKLDVLPTSGWVDTKTAQSYYFALRRAGFRGTAPDLGVHDSPSLYLTQFRARFRHCL